MTNKLLKFGILVAFIFGCFQGTVAQVTVTIDGSANWIGYANVFFTNGDYAFGSEWGVADIKSEINATDNTVTLHPNFNAYNDNPGDPFWSNGNLGNKIFEGSTYVEITDDITGQDLTFTGTVQSHTLDSEYVAIAFIKGLNPNNGWSADISLTAPLVAGGTFSLTAQNIPAGLVIQYGFSVTGLNANPADEVALGNIVVGEASGNTGGGGQITETIDGSANWIGYANVFFTNGDYAFGSEWGVADIKSEINAMDNTVTLHPNFNAYNDNPGDPFWSNGSLGNKIFEGSTYVEIADDITGQDLTFTGTVQSHTLDSEYIAIAFIKGLNPNNGWNTDILVTTPLVAGNTFSLTTENIPAGLIMQYGFSVTGLNANPADEATLGNVVIGQATASVNNFDNVRFSYYPNPVKDVLNISFNTEITNVSVMNMIGQVVINQNARANDSQLDMSSLSAGNYIVRVTSEGIVKTIKIIKQ